METMKDMFFAFRYAKRCGGAFVLSAQSAVNAQTNGYAKKYMEKLLAGLPREGKKMNISLSLGYSAALKEEIGGAFAENSESYAIRIQEDAMELCAETERGLIYAVAETERLLKADALEEMLIFDYPDKAVRGYRIFTPGERETEIFQNMIDLLVSYKYNTVMIEVGGAMEYKRRPEINREWVKWCAEVNKSPDEADRIQHKTFPWTKNSIHTNNGAGGFISQEKMKELIAYCRERELEVIPEVPTLSHSDYIVRPYRDLNERAEDTYPDTYCPSNPKTYEVVFDILDEVIAVFEPNYINIGHDEGYTFAKCEKCRGKDPVELYVGDIVKIHDYLANLGIQTMMWGEKVYGDVYVTDENGKKWPVGGTGSAAQDIPRLADCAGKIPTDVTLLQWYWALVGGDDEKAIADMGYRMIYGNFQGSKLKDYRNRIGIVEGGFVSNWGSAEEVYMQRNGQNYSLLTTAYIFWNGDYCSEDAPEVHEKVKDELYRRYKASLGGAIIELEHTTDAQKPYRPFYDGYYIVPDEWIVGWHEVTYTDGTTAQLPVIYGYNIRGSRQNTKAGSQLGEAEANVADNIEPIGASYPIARDGKVFYKTAYANPYPEKTVAAIAYRSKDGVAVEVKEGSINIIG